MYSKREAEILGQFYAILVQYGAASLERIMTETRLEKNDVLWAAFQLRCNEGGGLYSLPENMLPSGWDCDPSSNG